MLQSKEKFLRDGRDYNMASCHKLSHYSFTVERKECYRMKKQLSDSTLQQLIFADKKAYAGYLQDACSEHTYKEYLPLHKYVLSGKINKITEYISAGYNINTPDIWGRTAIYYSIFNRSIKIFKLLIENGADYHFIDAIGGGATLLQLAAAEGYLDKVKYMVEELNLNIFDIDKDNHTILFYSMLFGQVDIAEYLIEQGATFDPNIEQLDVLTIHLIRVLNKLNKKVRQSAIIPFNLLNKIKNINNFLSSSNNG